MIRRFLLQKFMKGKVFMERKKQTAVFLIVFIVMILFSVTAYADLSHVTPDGANAILYCKDTKGNTLGTYYFYGTPLSSSIIGAPSFKGYTPEASTIKIICGLIYTREFTLTYTINQYTLTIDYVYANGSTAAPSYTAQKAYMGSYSISSPSISGYVADKTSVYGTMGTADKTITVTYSPKVYTVTVNYVYTDGRTAAPSQSIRGATGTSYSFTSPTIPGYTPDKSVVSGSITGNMTIEVTYTASGGTSSGQYLLTIQYVYSTGGSAAAPYISTLAKGNSYSISSPSISGYTADKSIVSGTLNSDTVITVTYYKNATTQYTLTIYYKFKYSENTAAATYTQKMDAGSYYQVTSPAVSGYTANQTSVSGTLNSNRKVTVDYSAVASSTRYTLTIFYKYANGTMAAPTYNGTYASGAYYSVSSPMISGYTASPSVVGGYMTGDYSVTVTYSSAMPKFYYLTIHYRFEDGSAAAPSYHAPYASGMAYNVQSPSIPGYTPSQELISGRITYHITIIVIYRPNPDSNLRFEEYPSSGEYQAGKYVITSFYVVNNGGDVLPASDVDILFEVRCVEPSGETTIVSMTWEDYVIPADESGLVYFKWRIPANCAGCDVICTVSYKENKESITRRVYAPEYSQTPDTRYERTAPPEYTGNVPAPDESAGQVIWEMWEYEDGAFVLKRYGFRFAQLKPSIAPSESCWSAIYEDGKCTMKSGYGITLVWRPAIVALTECDMPSSNSFVSTQSAYATFPEYRYATDAGTFRTLESTSSDGSVVFEFFENADALDMERVHFIPVYVIDGDYVVSVTATQIWTPVGMFTYTQNSNVIEIAGTVFDDWYVG